MSGFALLTGSSHESIEFANSDLDNATPRILGTGVRLIRLSQGAVELYKYATTPGTDLGLGEGALTWADSVPSIMVFVGGAWRSLELESLP
jgi:hypothetical protein